ncbi:MAG: PKD domain-containing protein [Sphingobacteriales bacterium]|nr:MAG: PKD domain-containing protein [Sphingobacteriales bacterium]
MFKTLKYIFRFTFPLLFLLFALYVFPAKAQVKFIPNKGQWQPGFQYKSQLGNGAAYIGDSKIWYSFLDGDQLQELHHQQNTQNINAHTIALEWLGANKNIVPLAKNPSSEYYNYYLTKNQNGWRTGIRAFSKLYYKHFYNGIDMEVEGLDNALKYTYFVEPQTSPEIIKLKLTGAKKLYLQDGNLHIVTTVNSILEEAPIAYQTINKQQVDVPCKFVLEGNILSFAFPQGYNKNVRLVIDPKVIFATFSGSIADNFGFTATYDAKGNAFGGGTVYGTKFFDTTKIGGYQIKFAGGKSVNGSIGDIARDCGILKFSPDGKKLLWASYLGGSHNEQPHSMVADINNNLLVFGTTYSKDFPVSANGYDTSQNGESDIFAVKLSEDGKKLLGGTYIGGSAADGLNGLIPTGVINQSSLGYNYGDQFRGEIICDSLNNVYIGSTTFSKNFPVSTGAVQKDTGGMQDGCIIKLNSNLTSLLWSTYIGGKGEDAIYSLQLDKLHNVYACGGTTSSYFFKDTSNYNHKYAGAVDGFVTILKNDGKSFINSSYIGTSAYDQAYFIQLDKDENVYLYGQTRSNSFPVKKAGFSNPKSGQFITKLNKGLDSIIVSSVFGSGRTIPDISPTAFLVDNCGKIYISGWGGGVNEFPLGNGGSTKNMPLTPDAFQKTTDSSDFYLAVFASNMDTILYGSYFGGPVSEEHVDGGTSRFDKKGVIYQSVCAGCGRHSDFPVTDSAWSKTNNSNNCNNLVFKVNLETPDIIVEFDSIKPNCQPYTVQFKNKSVRVKTYLWDFGDGKTSTVYNPKHTFDSAGTYKVRLIGTNFFSCSVHDTVYKNVVVIKNSDPKFTVTKAPCSNEVFFEATGYGTNFRWNFGDSTFANGRKVSHKFLFPKIYTIKLQVDSGTLCAASSSQTVKADFATAVFQPEYDTCKPIVTFKNFSFNAKKYKWFFGDGGTDTAKNPVHDYKVGGNYDVTLIAYDSAGCPDTFFSSVIVADVPIAQFSVTPDACHHKIQLQNTSNSAKTFYWEFGDGKTSALKDPEHEYALPGTYTIKLTINKSTKCPSSFTQTVKIVFPTADFAHAFVNCEPLVKFTNKSIFSNKYIWDFGDGDSDTSKNINHYYNKPGNYLVKLIVKDTAGCTDSAFAEIKIGDTARAEFRVQSDTCSGIIYFADKSNLANSYFWKFGDGTTDTLKNPSHNYAQKGKEYKVTLIINLPDGCVDSTSHTVFPMEPPKAAFQYLKDSCSPNVKFFPSSYRAGSYLWEFGDGDTSWQINPQHAYKTKGSFDVRLIINPFTECADTAETSLYNPREKLQKPTIYNVITPNGDNMNEVFEILNLAPCSYYELEIYNRWGQIIYENKGSKMYWDGTTKQGKTVAEGVYFYIFKDPIFGEQHGTITVIR